MASPSIVSIFPVNGYTVFPIGGEIILLMSRQVDISSLDKGIFLYGPDSDVFTGPGMINRYGTYPNRTTYDRALNSPGFSGTVDIEIELFKCDVNGNILEDQTTYDYEDETYSRVVVKPISILQEKTTYTLYLVGAGDNDNADAICSVSVLDAQPDDANTSTGKILSSGTYTGTTATTITITCTSSGDAGEATFTYVMGTSDPVTLYGSHESIFIDDGVFIDLYGDSSTSFIDGDTWTILVQPAEYMLTTYKSSFTTIFPAIEGLPTSISSSPIMDDITLVEDFALVSVTPPSGASHVSNTTNTIVFTFNKNLEPNSVTYNTIEFLMQRVDGSTHHVEVPYSYMVADKRIIVTIQEHN
jgi:hypothetical protein